MSRPDWFFHLVRQIYPLPFVLAPLTRMPGMGRVARRMFFHGDRTIVLPRDSSARIPVGRAVAEPETLVLPSAIVDYFIEQASYHWIMNTCICRAGNGCRDYPASLGCLFLGQAVLDIHPRWGRLVTRAEAMEHVRLCRAAGLIHTIGRNKLDTIWLGAGPGHRLLAICSCCPCCCLWRIAPDLDPQIGARISKMPGVNVTVTERCAGCGTCCSPSVCFVGAIKLVEGRAQIGDACRGCGRCVDVCPAGAIQLSIDEPAYFELTVGHLASVVDLS